MAMLTGLKANTAPTPVSVAFLASACAILYVLPLSAPTCDASLLTGRVVFQSVIAHNLNRIRVSESHGLTSGIAVSVERLTECRPP